MTTIHPAIAAGVAANEDVVRMLESAADRLHASGMRSDTGDVINDMIEAIAKGRTYTSAGAILAAQIEIDRAANRTNRQAKRQRCKAARRQRFHADRRAKASRWLGTVQETLAEAREAMLAEGFRPCERCSMLTLSQPCDVCTLGR